MNITDFPKKSTPIPPSRRAELSAWLLSLILIVVLFFTSDVPSGFRIGAWVLLFLSGIAACILSLGNYLDRHTSYVVSEAGLVYTNGLLTREVHWEDIDRLEYYKGEAGGRVVVTTPLTRFAFRTLTEVVIRGKMKDRYGLEQGEELLNLVVERAGLKMTKNDNPNTYYYTRD